MAKTVRKQKESEKPPLRRPVRGVDNGGQAGLFALDQASVPSPRRAPDKARFVDDSPQGIFIGRQSLGECLRDSGERDVFVLRGFLRQLDWSEFESAYRPSGRSAYAPSVIVGIVLLGIMQGIDSLRALESEARFNIRYWWLTGGARPDHSVIGRFLNLHKERLTESFFEDLTGGVLKRTGSSARSVAGDGTVTQAAASSYRRMKREAAEQQADKAQERARQEPEDQEAQKKAEQARKVLEALQRREAAQRRAGGRTAEAVVSPSEPDAVFQPSKSGNKEFSHRPSVLANQQRVIVAQRVESSSEEAAIEPMLDSAQRISDEPLQEILLDGNYYCSRVAGACARHRMRMLCPPPQRSGRGVFPKRAFCYNPWGDFYLCPAGQRLIKNGQSNDRGRAYVSYATSACGDCALRSVCTRAPRRIIKRYQGEIHKESVARLMTQPVWQERYRKRKAWVEPVFGEIKHIQKLYRFRRRGLPQVRLEFALHAMAHNLRRLLVLTAPLNPPFLPLFALPGTLIRALRTLFRLMVDTTNFDFLSLRSPTRARSSL